jgi:surface polysaccharide O-acyltransferase-like enzyme
MKTEYKNVGIEALRFISMLMILILHYFNQGNVLKLTYSNMSSFPLIWIIEGVCLISVNIYMLISGYFLSDKKYSWRRLLSFYVTVFFYSVTLTAGLLVFHKTTLDIKNILSVFPIVGSRSNWFVSVYFAVLLISPILNLIINSIDQTLYKRMLIVLFVLFSVIPTFFFWIDQFDLNDGYSILWYSYLYLLAAYIKRYGVKVRMRTLIFMFCTIFILPISKIFIMLKLSTTPLGIANNMFYAYNAFPVFLAALSVFLFVIRKKERIENKWYDKIFLYLGKVSFGVFFIHSFVLLRTKLWVFLGSEKYIGSPLQLLHGLVSILIVYAVCSVVDTCKSLIFKYCGIDSLIKKFSSKLDERFSL